MADVQIRWTGLDEMARQIRVYRNRVLQAVRQVANYWAAVFEEYAKRNAPWQDQTGNARQSLHAFVEDLSNDTVALYLSHGVDYGIHLETRYAGRYEIIMPTIRRHLPAIQTMLQAIFG